MNQENVLPELVSRLRRRTLRRILGEEIAWAGGGVLCALALMLVAGRQILDWPWMLGAAVLGAGVAAYRTWRRAPSAYRVVCAVDRHLGLHDTLSTAHYFARAGAAADEIRQAQRAVAEQMARTVDPRAALPPGPGLAYYSLGAAGLLAAGLFGLRYGVTRSLDLRPPMVQLAFDGYRGPVAEQASNKKSAAQEIIDEQLRKMGVAPDQRPTEALGDSSGKYDAGKPQTAPDGSAVAERDQTPTGRELETSGNADGAPSGKDGAEPQEGRSSPPPASDGKARPTAPPSEKDNLLRKLQDAMANLLEKMKIKPPPGLGQQTASSKGVPQPGGRHQARAEKGAPGQGRQESAENAASADLQGQTQPGQGQRSAQAAQGHSGERGAQRPSPQAGRSGAGRQDGDKAIKDAEQLAAMGKISEILGRRAAELKGEVLVEVRSGDQQLKTQYSQKQAVHTDSGGEIHRDEIPLLYQPYVQQYFEQIRKTPAK
jgi:hypothetical protein